MLDKFNDAKLMYDRLVLRFGQSAVDLTVRAVLKDDEKAIKCIEMVARWYDISEIAENLGICDLMIYFKFCIGVRVVYMYLNNFGLIEDYMSRDLVRKCAVLEYVDKSDFTSKPLSVLRSMFTQDELSGIGMTFGVQFA